MKRIIPVLAIVLILTFSLVGGVFALDRPYMDPWTPGGETHPWGGDEIVVDPPPINKYEPPSSFTTGYTVLDVVINYFLFDAATITRLEEMNNRSNEDGRSKRLFRKNLSHKEVIR